MTTDRDNPTVFDKKSLMVIVLPLVLLGLGAFVLQLAGSHPERAWQTYLINFLLWSSLAQGGLLFSTVMHLTRARWSGPLQNLSESFVAFFPISVVLFFLLFLGKGHLFPWQDMDLHGKAVWLNIPFLFSRDLLGLLVLYGLGLLYTYYALRLKLAGARTGEGLRAFLCRNWTGTQEEFERCRNRMSVLSVLYILAYAFVLTLLAFDLVMSMDPHWYSTLFGPYSFVKAFYLGLVGLMILSALLRLRHPVGSGLSPSHFHDLGKLLFAFCLLWADFFYAQLLVIWYGNLPEETSYVITRTMMVPWRSLAWFVLIISFLVPFFILLNRNVKTRPVVMILLCALVLMGLWLEHLLLLGPALSPQAVSLPLNFSDLLITLGFAGLLAWAVTSFLNLFPELALTGKMGAN